MSISDNARTIISTIPSSVTLVAATKNRTLEEIKQAIDAGITIIGENYVQEAEEKYGELKGRVKFHLIGHLQKNKVKRALNIFDMIQTIDSPELAEEISRRAEKPVDVLIEINIGKEPDKTGVMPEESVNLIKEISKLNNIKIKGLMAMAPYFKNPEEIKPYFREMKKLFYKIKELNIENVEMKILSMGMSDSYKIAIEEGANMVRLGTVIFGKKAL